MTIQAVFFDMGGTIETYGFTRAQRLEATTAISQRLKQAGIDPCLGDEQLLNVITTGLDRYKRHSIQTLDELPPTRSGVNMFFPATNLTAPNWLKWPRN